jgi:uncharacterized protein YkwD
MNWAPRPATGPPTGASAGRHRRTRSNVIGPLAVAGLLVLMVAGAMFSPTLIGWPPPSDGTVAAVPSTVGTTPGGTTAPTPPPTRTATPTVTRPPRKTAPPLRTLGDFEVEVLRLTNAARQDEGCSALRMDSKLRTAARRHSNDMARFGYMSHTGHDGSGPAQRIRAAGYQITGAWAENIARGYPSPAAVMDGWLNSPGHRANIVNCSLRAIGVGVVRSTGGRLYWTQDFGAR